MDPSSNLGEAGQPIRRKGKNNLFFFLKNLMMSKFLPLGNDNETSLQLLVVLSSSLVFFLERDWVRFHGHISRELLAKWATNYKVNNAQLIQK